MLCELFQVTTLQQVVRVRLSVAPGVLKLKVSSSLSPSHSCMYTPVYLNKLHLHVVACLCTAWLLAVTK